MKEPVIGQTTETLNRAIGAFIHAHSEIACTLLEMAAVAGDHPKRLLRAADAKEALDNLERFLAQFTLDPKQRSDLEELRDRLRLQLQRVVSSQ